MDALQQQRVMVYPAQAFRVDTGAHIGDPLGPAQAVCLGDVFRLSRAAQAVELVLKGPEGARVVDAASSVGAPGESLRVIARHMLMGNRGARVEVVLLWVGDRQMILPLGPLTPLDEYTLMTAKDTPEAAPLASATSVSFCRGTRIALGTGARRAVEDLAVGDLILTRDHGPQPIRWIGQQTLRAEGNQAPVVITKGALHNADDLVLAPDHRLFVYQRRDAIGVGRAEVLVRARYLVNGDTIFHRAGGHVDYFHLLLDRHEMLFAEGIQAESLLVTPEVLAGFTTDLRADLRAAMDTLDLDPNLGAEPAARDLAGLDTAALLRRAAKG